MAANAAVQSWSLDEQTTADLFERTAEKIRYHQNRNARARRSHTKTKINKLKQVGIDPTALKNCKDDTS